MKTLHVYNRAAIMRRAWAIARQRREETARRAYDLDVRVVGAKIIHNRPLSAHIAAIPLDLGAAQKLAWAEAKGLSLNSQENPSAGAMIVRRTTGRALAPLRRIRFARVFRLMSNAVRWISARFIPSRAA